MRTWNKIFRLPALLLVFIISLSLVTPAFAAGDTDTIYINTAKDLLELAADCSLDTWSRGKTVVLQSDISLADVEFLPIPTFGGTFDGKGHTISGLNIVESITPAGLFSYVQKSAIIRDLKVTGTIDPSGDGEIAGGIAGENNGTILNCTFEGTVSSNQNTGGIAGINASSGVIKNCQSGGAVFGENMTGGIVGYNLGTVSFCENDAYVNITSVDPSMRLDEINVDSMLNIKSITSTDTSTSASDTGGIAGYSAGILKSCRNRSTIGYQHIGYNVGGIVGRSCGYILECENTADVYGRKDVGGIAGQIEPYISMDMSENTLAKLKRQMNELNGMINRALDDTHSSVGTVSSRLNKIADYLDSAAEAVSNISTYGAITSTVAVDRNSEEEIDLPDREEEITQIDENTEITLPGTGGDIPEIDWDDTDVEVTTPSVNGSTATTEIRLNTSLHGLPSAVNGMTSQMRQLNGEITGNSGTLTEDLKAISNQINAISNTVFEAMLGEDDGDIMEDTSEVNIEKVTLGKTASSKNSGSIYGDISVGGVAGSMAIEYELDPEDDVTANLSGRQRQKYEMKAIVQNCVNTGEITSKRSYVGGICGRMNLGYLTCNENYGKIESENGDYVGGIAGLASSTISGCYVKCTLGGANYIGGIVGSGAADDSGESSSTVDGCYSMVEITDYEQYAGAISGAYAGTFTDNFFVSDELAGINRLSYTGIAEPISYSKLIEEPEIPDHFKQFTLRFVVDEETVKTVAFEYGESFDETIFPPLPEKEGCYGKWDKTDLKNLHFDTDVTAVYTQYVSALESTQKRSDGHSIFFVEGWFDDLSKLTVTGQPKVSSDFDGIPDGFWDTLAKCYTGRKLSRKLVEQWKLEFSDDTLKSHKIRYLAPDGNAENLDIYVKQEDGWTNVDTEAMGSYMTFMAEGNSVEMAAIYTMPVWWIWMITVFLVLVLLLCVCRKLRKMKKKPEKIAELPQETEESETSEKKSKMNKNWKKKLPAIMILVCVIGIAAACLRFSGFITDFKAYDLLKKYADKSEITMELNVEGEIGTEQIDFTALVDKQKLNGIQITGIESHGMKLYYANETVFLENGNAYKVSDLYPDYSKVLEQTMEIYRLVNISAVNRDGRSVYTITAEKEDAKALLKLFMPYIVSDLSDTQTVSIELYVKDNEIEEIYFTATGTLNDEKKTDFTMSAVLEIKPEGREHMKIPRKVQDAVIGGTEKGLVELTDNLYRLASAWGELEARQPLAATLRLSADCGPVVISDRLELYRQTIEDLKVTSLQKNGYALYFTDKTICDKEGNSISSSEKMSIDAVKLLELAYDLSINADMTINETDNKCVYILTLDQKGMESVAYAIAPDVRDLNVDFESGSLQFTIEQEKIRNLQLSCKGKIKIMISEVDATFGAEFDFEKDGADFTVPQKAFEALKEKEGI